jgi:hypothetical protein
MLSSPEIRFRAFSSRTPVRRAGVAVLALLVLTNMAMITPELFQAPSRRMQIALAIAWCLGMAALFMLLRLWTHIAREARSAPHVGV